MAACSARGRRAAGCWTDSADEDPTGARVAAPASDRSRPAWRWRRSPPAGPVATGGSARPVRRATGVHRPAAAVWFTWPAWPLALWTLWRWRRQLGSRHVALPLWFCLVVVVAAVLSPHPRPRAAARPARAGRAGGLRAAHLRAQRLGADRLVHAAVLQRLRAGDLGDLAVAADRRAGQAGRQRGQAGAGFRAELLAGRAFIAALAGDVAWLWLVRWRTARNREAIWKSLVLPAGGAALGWLLVMTLWLPVLDYARSYAPVVQRLTAAWTSPAAWRCSASRGAARRPALSRQARLRAAATPSKLSLAGGPPRTCSNRRAHGGSTCGNGAGGQGPAARPTRTTTSSCTRSRRCGNAGSSPGTRARCSRASWPPWPSASPTPSWRALFAGGAGGAVGRVGRLHQRVRRA